MTAVPQNYTVHCLINETCQCAEVNSSFNYHMFMEGSLSEPAIDYCDQEPSLSCSENKESNDELIVDNQLTVTWSAGTEITQGDYHTITTRANGDHDFLCVSSFTVRANVETNFEQAFVSIRGIYMHSHACK